MDAAKEEANANEARSASEDENDVFEDLPKPALRRIPMHDGDNTGGKARHKPDRIKSWYITGPSNFGALNVSEPSAIPVTRICDIGNLAAEANIPLHDPELEKPDCNFFQSVYASQDGKRIYFILNDSSRLYRYADNQLAARTLRLSDQEGKRLKPRHLCVDEDEKLIFVSGEIDMNDTTANVLARFRLPDDNDWQTDSNETECKYMGRSKIFENMEKFGSLDLHRHVAKVEDEENANEENANESTELKENEDKSESTGQQDEASIWIASPQISHKNIEKTQIFKLTRDFKHKRCTVSLGRHGVCYLPRHLSIDDGGWVYVSVDRVESGPQGSTKLYSSRLLTFPSRPMTDANSSEPTRNWMRVNSWHFEGLTPGFAIGITSGESALILDRDRGCLHKVTWVAGAIEGHGEAGCVPVLLKPDAATGVLPSCFHGIGRLDSTSVLLYKDLEIYQLRKEDLQ